MQRVAKQQGSPLAGYFIVRAVCVETFVLLGYVIHHTDVSSVNTNPDGEAPLIQRRKHVWALVLYRS